MSLRWRIFCAAALAALCLGLMAAALVWQAQAHAGRQQAQMLLQAQAHAWQQLQTQQMQQLQRLAAQLAEIHARTPGPPLQRRMLAMAREHAGLRIDLLDEDASLLATTADGADAEPLLDAQALQRWRQHPQPMAGLHQATARGYHWLQPQRIGAQVLVLGQDASAALPLMAQRLRGEFFLLNLRGTPVAGSVGGDASWPQAALPARAAQVLTLPEGDPRLAGQPALQLVSQPLAGARGSVVGSLVWKRAAGEELQRQREFLRGAAAQLAAVLALALGGLWMFLRHALDPLAHNVQVLQSLAAGRTEVAPHPGEEDAEDESGKMARAALQLRAELLSLETLRQERLRARHQQERLIREQLRSLAESLDPGSREEILQALSAPAAAKADEAPNVLAELASILGRMSALVSTQQGRLLRLLREVQASVHTQTMLASLQQELEIAREMQLSILPRRTPDRPEVEVAPAMIPAKEVGGDFYDYFALDEDHLALVIADVSGKGVPAAFFMAISRTLLKSSGLFLRTPGTTIAALNDQLCLENDQMMFVTVFYAVLQLSTGRLTYVNAGHNPPILLRQGSAQYFPRGRNMGLAVLENQQYHEGTLQLAPGDCLLLYTDGVTEATDAQGALLGEARLLEVAQSFSAQPDRSGPARQLTERVVEEVRRFEAGAAQADDITVVALAYRGDAP